MCRTTPTAEKFENPANASFTQGAFWYFGEILHRVVPSRWVCSPRRGAFGFAVQRDSDDDWLTYPASLLTDLLDDGHPLGLHDVYYSWTRQEPAGRHEEEWMWTGQDWQSPLETWMGSIAARILGLREAGLPSEVQLDFSAESLYRLEEFALAHDDAVTDAVAAYLGETLLRVGGGYWSWGETPCYLNYGMPIISSYHVYPHSTSPIRLVHLARQQRNGVTFTQVYRAWERHARIQKAMNPKWFPAKPCTSGLDPEPAPTPVEVWCAERQRAFPAWIAQYGHGGIWDFSRDSLDRLTDVIMTVTPTWEQLLHPDNAEFAAGAVWYYGDTLRRAKPSRWEGRGESSLQNFWVHKLDREEYNPIAVLPVQDLRRMFGTSPHGRLRDDYGRWVIARSAARAKRAVDRRGRKRSRRKQSDSDYLATWLAAREREFPDWIARFGADGSWDFSPESLDALETLVLRIAPTPEELLDDQANADFLNGAIWYCGEVFRRAEPEQWRWAYERNFGPDCCLGSPDGRGIRGLIDCLSDVYCFYDSGAYRRAYGRCAR
ncbi:hypothetical protein OH799_33425 [Nocardia sp. NBC_00881]|uniref:hypothetical protein n=1 Tax=Nocardia sp. NBC_00881 TaxID=2975995 RepID=UPI003864690E|nr:hypothetical protein OH799_33425 [Nocardia sp. NBC_00881]